MPEGQEVQTPAERTAVPLQEVQSVASGPSHVAQEASQAQN